MNFIQSKYRWPTSLFIASLFHGLIFLILTWQWTSDHLKADNNAAPLVIRLASLAKQQPLTNNIISVVQENKPQAEEVVHVKENVQPEVFPLLKPELANLKHQQKENQITKKNEKEVQKEDVKQTDNQTTRDMPQELASQQIKAEEIKQENTAKAQGHQSEIQQLVKLNWQSKVMAHLAQKKRYPRMARKRKQEGTVFVRFNVDKVGNVGNVEVIKKSKFNLLNKEAIAVVVRATPLPIPPGDFLVSQKKIIIPIKFYLL